MAGLKIEGDLTQINERQLEFIKSVIEKRGYKDSSVIIEAVGKAGDNYVANVKRVIIDDGKGSNLKMIAKVAPTIEQLRMVANTEQLFRNEHIMYTKVLPKFTQLEAEADIPPQERLRYAACYGSLDEAPNEVILLEDLGESNFVMLDRFRPIGAECVKSVLKNFAVLHSLSYALKHKQPEEFEKFKNDLFDMWSQMENMEETMMYFKQVEISASMIVDTDIHKKMISGAVTGSMKEYVKMAKADKDSKYLVIQQGDAWTNNIMFKFDDEILQDSVMIDYQVSKPSNPVADILYMIFNCTDYESRKEHFHDWIDYYHTELDKALSNYNLKANFIYPKDRLDTDLKRYAKTSFGQNILLAGVLSMKTEEAGEMKAAMESADMDVMLKNSELSNKDPETIALFKNKIVGVIESYREFGLL